MTNALDSLRSSTITLSASLTNRPSFSESLRVGAEIFHTLKNIIKLTETQLAGSGGWINANLTEEQVKKSKLVPNMDNIFYLPLIS